MRLDPSRVLQRFLRRLERRWNPPVQKPATKTEYYAPLPKTLKEAAAFMVDRPAITTKAYRDRQVYQWTGVHPDIIEFTRKFIKELERRGIPMYAFELMRTPERQNNLLANGRSKAKAWSSPHQYGCAVDIVSHTKYWDLTPKQWDVLGAIGKEIARKMNVELTWGGDWKFYDPAHWQLTNWREYKEMYDRDGRVIETGKSAAKAMQLITHNHDGTRKKARGGGYKTLDPALANRYGKYLTKT